MCAFVVYRFKDNSVFVAVLNMQSKKNIANNLYDINQYSVLYLFILWLLILSFLFL